VRPHKSQRPRVVTAPLSSFPTGGRGRRRSRLVGEKLEIEPRKTIFALSVQSGVEHLARLLDVAAAPCRDPRVVQRCAVSKTERWRSAER
tara:strand:- start:276 stop:545 length:270 start_codon:yes stop_codon:yes gene_type:complete